MNLVSGQLNTNNSSFSYAAQSPWIFADTLRNNILFNQNYDEQRYRDVICACSLDIDMNLLGTSGDRTFIGEKGVNLSGGQKARVSLARALYVNADIYLLDDPFASVDRLVAKQISQRCFSKNGLFKDKTCLLITHQTEFVKDAHQIIFLSQGHIDESAHFHNEIEKKEQLEEEDIDQISSLIDDVLSGILFHGLVSLFILIGSHLFNQSLRVDCIYWNDWCSFLVMSLLFTINSSNKTN